MLKGLSQQNLSKPSALRVTDTNETWDVSRACVERDPYVRVGQRC